MICTNLKDVAAFLGDLPKKCERQAYQGGKSGKKGEGSTGRCVLML